MSDRRHDIEKYLRGEMSPSEMHKLEKEALSDPFLAEALEGASSIDHKDFATDVDELNRSIRKQKVLFTPLRIAAGILLLISVGFYYFMTPEPKEELVQNEASEIKSVDTLKNTTNELKADTQLIVQEVPAKKRQSTSKPKVETDKTQAPTVTKADSITQPDYVAVAPVPMVLHKIHNVSGKVTTSEDGLPLPGVTVLVKGTTRGTTTDINGFYSLDVADSSSLVFSFVGMQSSEMGAKDKSQLNVKMTEDVSQLSEVVIARAPVPQRDDAESEPVINLAEPVGGIRAYDKYLENNRQYPQQALDNDVKGRVIVGFDVGVNGEISNFKVIRSLGHGCDDEVIRLVKTGPAWRPTTEDNKAVESTVHVKMKFDAVKYKKKKK